MTALATIAAEYKARMFDLATDLYASPNPELLVSYGRPAAVNIPDNLCMVLGVSSEFAPGAIGPTRQREETLQLEMQWWIFRPGLVDAEREATDYLYSRLGELEQLVRVTDPTLGNLVRTCALIRHQFDTTEAESRSSGAGRLAVATATFEASVRIRI